MLQMKAESRIPIRNLLRNDMTVTSFLSKKQSDEMGITAYDTEDRTAVPAGTDAE